jgi:phosphopantothenoylcysteine decarboxylase/phosphopantothenate--cysteine ligase
MLKGKKILLGITGSIAAYKAATLVRLFVKQGAEVQVIMTELAKEFISPLTMATLSNRPILVDFFDPTNGNWNSHVKLGLWADVFLIAPATANTIGKMAQGIADNLLLTSYLSAKCPVVVAPAMDLDMFVHTATQKNIQILESYGNLIIEPGSGELASGLEGKGRMEEPESIVQFIDDLLTPKLLKGKKILITAGPTYEKIDPVRFIGNFSTGKMGYALAEVCAQMGAFVQLISGPVSIKAKHENINVLQVESAEQMYNESVRCFDIMDGGILCAAVADFTPKIKNESKIKRLGDDLKLELVPTTDIAFELGNRKNEGQFLVGFALETDNEETNALKKLQSKKLDFIVLNSLNDENAGFGFDTNKVSILHRDGKKLVFDLKSKQSVAEDIINEIIQLLNN